MDNLNKKARLIDDWSWVLYEDGSGHIENSKGKQFCSFDYTTQEVKDLNNRWQFMNEYPYRTPWEMFKTDVENTLVSNGLASYNDTVKSIAKLEEKLNINKDFRLFNDNQFVDWKSYYDLPKVEKTLSDMEAAMKTTNSFDLSIADRLCDSYPVEAVCSMLTDSQKEILILGVEFERDFGNDVSENLYELYKAITAENTMLNDIMKKNVSIPIDEEKLTTLRIYMEQKNVDLEEELTKAIDSLYLKYVPIAVRDFFAMRDETLQATKKKKSTKSATKNEEV